MALLENGRIVPDRWTFLADDAPVPPEGAVVVSLARLKAEWGALNGRGDLGVRLASNELAGAVADHLPALSLVAVEFPKFRDGRGFSIARELREQHGFAGEVRAVGHTIPDQYRFLLRCGFSTVEIPDGHDGAAWRDALGHIQIAYQRALDDARPVSALRRRFTQGAA